MKVVVEPDRNTMGIRAASIAGDALRNAIKKQGRARIVVATGSSQFEVLRSLVNEEGIDWSKVDGFHLDEYVGISADHPASFCGYLKSRFVDLVPINTFLYLDGTTDPREMCSKATTELLKAPIDLAMIGIGENAHLAFNDPPADFTTQASYHVVKLDEACRAQQVGEGWFPNLDSVPTHAISMTIHQILQARQIVCSVPDLRKADAVKKSIDGPIDPGVPASILRTHANTTLLLDSAAASYLDSKALGL